MKPPKPIRFKHARSTNGTPELNIQQLRFVDEYLKDLNATQSYIRAGYAAKSAETGSLRLLGDNRVQKILSQKFQKISHKAEVNVEFVLRELLQIANCDIGDAFNSDGSLKKIHDIPLAVRKSIASFDSEEIYEWAETSNGRKTKEWIGTLRKVKFWPKDRGLEMLGKYLAMFVERQRQEGPDGQALPAVQIHIHKHSAQPGITDAQTRPVVAEALSPNAA